jgi:hypothetical protein
MAKNKAGKYQCRIFFKNNFEALYLKKMNSFTKIKNLFIKVYNLNQKFNDAI